MAKLNWKIWLLIMCVIGSLLAIFPFNFTKGVLIASVDQYSIAYEEGLRQGMIITAINDQKIFSVNEYSQIMNQLFPPDLNIIEDKTLSIVTDSGTFTVKTNAQPEFIVSDAVIENNTGNNETKYDVIISAISPNSPEYNSGLRENQKIIMINNQTIISSEGLNSLFDTLFLEKEKQKVTITTTDNNFILFINKVPQITVKEVESSRIKTGLDLSGGSRGLVKAQDIELSDREVADLIAITDERLNVYGLSDVQIRSVKDLSGNNFMLVEIAGSTPSEFVNLIASQGKFEAKIGNETAFIGGEKDITYVARTGENAGVYSCGKSNSEEVCNFRFAITLSDDAAKKHASITCKLGLDQTNPQYLEKKLDLYLDDVLVDSLFIGKDLKCSETTQISISGSGVGATEKEAFNNANINMKQLQTILISGSLPFKLQIVKLDTISPLLGKEFITTILIAGFASVFAIGLFVFARYRNIKLSLAVFLTSISEVIIVLGISALFHRSLDLPAIAGIIAAIGTGVDSQIIILDESRLISSSLKDRIKNALRIIIGSFLTTLFALLPLLWAGAGLLKGFAITTIIGISVGVFITRPAFSEMVKSLTKE